MLTRNPNNRVLTMVVVLSCCLAGLALGKTPSRKATTKPASATVTGYSSHTPATSPAATKPASPRIANIRITGEVLESPAAFSLFGDSGRNKTLSEWLKCLADARQDDKVQAVALELDGASFNWSQAQELSDSIRRLNQVKPVYAHITTGRASHYIVASSARDLTMEPSGDLEIVGLAAEMMFYRGTLDKLGIEPQMIQVGKFKGASEPMMLTGPSDELKGEYNKLLDDLYDQLLSQIAKNRDMKVEDVRAAIDQGPFDAATAKKLNLVDTLLERAKWAEYVGKKVAPKGQYDWAANYGQVSRPQLDLSNPFALLASLLRKSDGENVTGPAIAVITAEGVIVSGSSGEGLLGGKMIGDRSMVRMLKEVADNANIKAVVLRIDSPGGSAMASEIIYQAIRACAEKKPVIASISGVGASGGYYISLGAGTIYADSTALVGSIGVISGKMALTGLYDKLGLSTFSFTRGKNAGLELSRRWDPGELETMRTLATRVYDQFVARVTESRGKKIAVVADVAQGRIFTARLAAGNGMIDKIGGLKEAVDAAKKAGGVPNAKTITLPKSKTLSDLLMGSADGDDDEMDFQGFDPQANLLIKLVGQSEGTAYLLNLCRIMQQQKILLALPYHVQIKG